MMPSANFNMFSMRLEIKNIIDSALKKINVSLENKESILTAIGQHMLISIEDTFKDEGPGWQKLSPKTIAQRKEPNKPIKILQDSTRLKQSIYPEITIDAVTIGPNLKEGSNVKYAAIHQFGGWAGRGHRTYIPPRPYTVIRKKDPPVILDLVEKWIAKIIRKAFSG